MIRIAKNILLFSLVLVLGQCVSPKQNALYLDSPSRNDTIFYNSSEIYSDYVTSEAWFTQSDRCISAETTKKAAYRGELGLEIKWDKTKEGCPWLGFGFGWDNWTGKDMSAIKNVAAVEFYVRMIEGERPTLPWAVGLEDFTGAQAWLGVTSNSVKAESITTEWTRIEMPLSEFNWDEQNADVSNIKQIIFNTEADGHIYIDEIEIVPYKGGFRKRATLENITSDQFKADGNTDDYIWKTQSLQFADNEVHLALDGEYLCVAAKVVDEDPRQNSFKDRDIWNGDAFEIAFSTDPEASTRRTNYLSSDQHIGFSLNGDQIQSWDWMEQRELKHKEYASKAIDNGYVFEARIHIKDLEADFLRPGKLVWP